MPRLLFVNRFFHPDHSATSQILSDLAFHLADAGFKVDVITSRQLYDDPSRALPGEETVRGVRVHRVWTTHFGRGRLLPRAVDYLTFYLVATAKIAAIADSDTVVIAETDPPLIAVPSAVATRLRGARLVNWTQDLFPEIAEDLGVPGMSIVSPILRRLRNLSLGFADTNVVLGDSMAARLRGEGVEVGKIAVIHNWSLVETESRADLGASNPLRREWDLDEQFVVGYSGNFGRAHDFATVLDAAASLRDRADVRFLLIGDGAQRRWAEERAAALGLTNVVFRPYQPRDRLHLSLSLPDVHLISLRAELEGLLVPSKLYAVLAAGRGVLFVGNAEGEIAHLIRQAGCGEAFSPGAGTELARTVRSLADDRGRAHDMGARARDLWASRFRREDALAAWRKILSR